MTRDELGKVAREAWRRWAKDRPQPSLHDSWTDRWEDLSETAREEARVVAEAVARAARPALAWTREWPTVPGWYWLKGRPGNWADRGVIVAVEIYPALRESLVIANGHHFPPIPPHALWAGPIPEPEEPR